MTSRFVKKPVNAWIAQETNITFVTGVCHIRSLLRFQMIVRNGRKVGEGMKELIIKVDDPGERVWDGSPKTFETQELVRCKDCKQSGIDSTSYPHYWCSAHSEYHDGDWFCADGEMKE